MLNELVELKYLYLFLVLASISYPLYKSWDPRIDFYKKWPAFAKANVILLLVMIPWDVLFTENGIWGFNAQYNLGYNLLSLPVEEWLFFICIPFACVFIYEVIVYYDTDNRLRFYSKKVSILFLLLALGMLVIGFGQLYTSVTAILLIILLSYHLIATNNDYLGQFYLAFAVMLIPFFVVNGVLTGSFIKEEVVWYNMDETFGIRLFTIPLEDIFYCLFMMLFLITFYEKFKLKRQE